MSEQPSPQPHIPLFNPYEQSAPPPHVYAPPPYGYAPLPLPGPPPELVAGMGRRFTAKAVDMFITVATVGVSFFLYGSFMEEAPENTAAALATITHLLVLVFAVFFYDPVLTALGGTAGKRLCGLRVARLETGQPVGFGVALGRHLMALLINSMTCLPLAYLWCTWDKPHHQGLHDKILRTVVVLRQEAFGGRTGAGWRGW